MMASESVLKLDKIVSAYNSFKHTPGEGHMKYASIGLSRLGQ